MSNPRLRRLIWLGLVLVGTAAPVPAQSALASEPTPPTAPAPEAPASPEITGWAPEAPSSLEIDTPEAPSSSETTVGPSFLLEQIVVEGVRREAARAIVAAESHLRPGESYSEADLADAVHRIKRLPFVLDAEFALRKGSARGAYELVVTVEETKPFFFSRTAQFLVLDDASGLALGYTPREGELVLRGDGALGARLFVGPRGMAFAAVRPNYTDFDGFSFYSAELGYTQYDLFGTGAVASVGVSRTNCCPTEVFPLGLDPNLTSWSAQRQDRGTFSLAVPLGGNHSLRLAGSRVEGEAGERRSFSGDLEVIFVDEPPIERDQVELAWVYDTTDDPVFPTQGLEVAAGVRYATAKTPLPGTELGPEDTFPIFEASPFTTRSRSRSLVANASKYWAITARQAVGAGVRASYGRSEIDNLLLPDRRVVPSFDTDTHEIAVHARHSWNLWGAERTRRIGDLRLETVAQFGREELSPDPRILAGSLTSFTVISSLVFRNTWGVLRVGVAFVDIDGGGR